MKTFFLGLSLVAALSFRATAQVDVTLALDQEQFPPAETIPLAVKITNRSGQPLHLGADAAWLTFDVESSDSLVVNKFAEVPVTGEFDLESSQMATKHVDLQPYFSVGRPGRYKITATLHIPNWSKPVNGGPKYFDVVNGAMLWTQDFGLPTAGGDPEVRKFTLEQANYLRSQLRLYVRLSDATDERVFKVAALGPMVSFGHPEAQVDRESHLHVLWQGGARMFNYCLVNPDGTVAQQETYDYYNTRPRLAVNETGGVSVVGGVRRPKSAEIPLVKAPNALPNAPVKP